MPRASLSADRGVANEFSSQAEHTGKTLYYFTSEWLDAASKISAEGGNAKRVLRQWRIWSILRQVDVITLPADFVEELISKLYPTEKDNLFAAFSELGANLAGLLKMVAPEIGRLSVLGRDFADVIAAKKVEILKSGDNSVIVNIVGAGKRIETTECSFEFVKAVLNGYGYSVSSRELGIGTIRIRAKKRGT